MTSRKIYVQVYDYQHSHGIGCTCTLRTARMTQYLRRTHGDTWEDSNGSYRFAGPFRSDDEAKVFVMNTEYYTPMIKAR